MRFRSLLLSAVFACPLLASAQNGTPTVAEARAFLDSANAELLTLTTRSQRADWVGETHITDDTEALDALINEQTATRILALVAESHRFDKLD
ncbi:MAG: M2 family metallopeptidase, partial [Acidobacteriota bacterium]|nr:M2 family metallopeptidase [Acidobacteriota bacterium]